MKNLMEENGGQKILEYLMELVEDRFVAIFH